MDVTGEQGRWAFMRLAQTQIVGCIHRAACNVVRFSEMKCLMWYFVGVTDCFENDNSSVCPLR